MKTIVIGEQATIPVWVHDLASFRRWTRSDEFPEQGRFAYLDGNLWVDVSMERWIQNQIKKEFDRVLANLEKDEDLGYYLVDRMLLTNVEVDLSTEPDGMFISNERWESGLAIVNKFDDTIEVTGSPDMTLEVVSATSVEKDTVELRRLYWEAGVKEYWLVDSREKSFSFDILRRGSSKFLATRKNQGWQMSQVFGHEFKLTRETTKHGVSKFTLAVR
jgi:Uma2 family endonuclease